MACWRGIAAPVLWINGIESTLRMQLTGVPDYEDRLKNIKDLELVDLADAGHMLHHDQPAKVAALIERFLATTTI